MAGRTGDMKADEGRPEIVTRPETVARPEALAALMAQLRDAGLRLTMARRMLLSALLESPNHPSAENLAAAVQAMAPDVNMSTVYRNLDELQRLGIVIHTHLGHGAATYHLASAAHGHLVCEQCGMTFDAGPTLFEGLAGRAMASHQFEIHPYHFAVPGRCVACR
ncbi:MAG: Fur family transcriptional regulator [Acidimicrobiales bacterium]